MTQPKTRHSPQERARRAWQRALAKLKTMFDTGDEIAGSVDITRQALWKWEVVPPARVNKVSHLTDIPPHVLRPDLPDLFPKPNKEK